MTIQQIIHTRLDQIEQALLEANTMDVVDALQDEHAYLEGLLADNRLMVFGSVIIAALTTGDQS